jgi:predicted transcriptional regulator
LEVTREHGINEMTVRNWLERDTAAGASAILETSRLRRENEALLSLVSQLTYESEQQKKNQGRAGR